MNTFDYKKFYDEVGQLNGWDFSNLKVIAEGVKWQFHNEVTQRCKPSDRLLDIGTGGGEAFLNIAHCCSLLVGIDVSTGMVKTANHNLNGSNHTNVRFLQMDAEDLDFPQNYFNVISCKHSPFNAKEVIRVLEEDGVFLTQQVSEDDKLNLSQAFRRGQSTNLDGTLLTRYMDELSEAGFRDIQSHEYDATEYYETYEDLVFLLKHTPIIPNFGKNQDDFAILHKFIADHKTGKGIETNSKRFMIIAKK